MPDTAGPQSIEKFTINEEFMVVRKRSTKPDGVEVFEDELFKDGVPVLTQHSISKKPESVLSSYLELQQEVAKREKARQEYFDSSFDDKKNYWRNYAMQTAYAGDRYLGTSAVVNISKLREQEPEINFFIDEMIRAVSELYGCPYKDTLAEHFALDQSAISFLKVDQLP